MEKNISCIYLLHPPNPQTPPSHFTYTLYKTYIKSRVQGPESRVQGSEFSPDFNLCRVFTVQAEG